MIIRGKRDVLLNFTMRRLYLLLLSLSLVGTARAVELPKGWPQFRGSRFDNNFPGERPPTEFGPEKNVVWKAATPSGQGSLCIVGNSIFLTAYDKKDTLQTIALNRRDGSVLWTRDLKPKQFETYLLKFGTPAAATCASDGERVVSYFGSFGLICYDLEGRELWRVEMPLPKTKDGFGSGTSPIIYDGLVYLLRDEDGPGQGLYAFDVKSGKELWKRKRDGFRVSFGSPVIWDGGVVVIGDLRVKGYDPKTGADRWVVRGLSSYPCTTPTPGADGNLYVATWSNGSANERNMPEWKDFLGMMDKDKDGKLTKSDAEGTFLADFFVAFDSNKNGLIDPEEWQSSLDFMARGKNAVLAIRPGGQGDITESHVLWSNDKGAPYVASPLFYEGRLYLVKDGGLLTIYEAATGKVLLEKERIGITGDFYASPIAADHRVFIGSQGGALLSLKSGDKLEVLSKADLGEPISATPVVVDNTLYVRTSGNLWAFREK
jgi:outer membrane protein assembly factor BamB